MLAHGVKGGLGPKLQGSHGTGQHPQHCQHHPQDADDAGEWGDHTIRGGGGGYVAQGLVHIYIYILWILCIYTHTQQRRHAYTFECGAPIGDSHLIAPCHLRLLDPAACFRLARPRSQDTRLTSDHLFEGCTSAT